MIDIKKIKNGYWWKAQEKHDWLVNCNQDLLLELTLQITDKCNLNCIKCNKSTFTGKEIPTEQVISILEQAYALGLWHAHITGGECTLHKGLPEITSWCAKHEIRVDISSNGKFDFHILNLLQSSGLDSINISWDKINEPPQCLDFIFNGTFTGKIFINHMVMPSNYKELPDFLFHIKENYPEVVDIQLMPPRGKAEKFTPSQIEDYYSNYATPAYKAAFNRFAMVSAKVMDILGPLSHNGIYHTPITWTCHRAKSELRVGSAGYSTCTYLYRDGLILAPLDIPVKDAWEICKKEILKNCPPTSMCDKSCSPEVAYFNLGVQIEKEQKEIK